MSVRNKKLDIPYSQIDDVQEYVEAFDLETSEIDFNVIDEYKESPYALDASTLNNINDDVNIMQNNWHEDIDETLDDKAELFQSWIDNLGEEVRPWSGDVTVSGDVVTFEADEDTIIFDLKADINPIQDGTPWWSDKNTSPYLMRKSPQLDHIYSKETDTLVGGTVTWNQLVQNGNFTDTSAWVVSSNASLTIANNEAVLTANADGTISIGETISNPQLHKYLISTYAEIPVGKNGFIQVGNAYKTFIGDGVYKMYSAIFSPYRFYSLQIYLGALDAVTGDVTKFSKCQVIDLTALFGSAEIADYVYSLEQTTAGAGVAWLKAHGFIDGSYRAYDSGSLQSVKTSEHNTYGKNLLPNTGAATPSSTGITWDIHGDGTATANGTASSASFYYFTIPSNLVGNFYFMGAPGISGTNIFVWDNTTESRAKQWDGVTNSESSYDYTTPIQVQLLSGHSYSFNCRVNVGVSVSNAIFKPMLVMPSTTDFAYEPYVKYSYPLDSDLELRGLFKLDANNNLYADGDVYESSGNVSRKYGIVDLGTLNWTKQSLTTEITDAWYTPALQGVAKAPASNSGVLNGIASNYDIGSANNLYSKTPLLAVNSSGILYVRNDGATGTPTGYLVYELATPTTEQADPYANPQIVSPLGTEEYIDTRDVPIPVGHETSYAEFYPISGWDEVNVWNDPIYGGNIEWNQLVQNGDFADTRHWSASGCSLSVSNNVATVTFPSTPSTSARLNQSLVTTAGHVYLTCATVSSTTATYMMINNINDFMVGLNLVSDKQTIIGISKISTGNSSFRIYVNRNAGGGLSTSDVVTVEDVMVIDLTQAFGIEIADYVYSLEQAHAGDGVAWFKNLFPNDYYTYNAGEETCVGKVNGDSYGEYTIDLDGTRYSGTLDVTRGELTVDMVEVDLGTLDWTKGTTSSETYGDYSYFRAESSPVKANNYNFICSRYETVQSYRDALYNGQISVYNTNSAGWTKFAIRDDAYSESDATAFKTAMSGVQLVYELATPITVQLTPTEVSTLLGTNNVWVDSGDVSLTYGTNVLYYKNDIVTYSEDVGAMFLCLQDCDGSKPLPTALTVVNDYWLRVYDKGKPGLNVYNLTDKGKFNWQNNYVVNDVVWMDERHINFYVCINNVSYTINNTPNYDSAHWVKLFTVYRDGMPVYWEIPNQSFFNDIYSPSIFGVAQGTSLNFDSIDVLNNITNITEEDSSLRLLENEIILLTIYKQDGNAYNSTPILHCGTLINVPLIESGVIYKIPLNFLFYNMHMGLLCIYEEGVGASFILAKLDNNDNVYYDIDGYIDENYFVYNKAQYESLFPNVPYIKIEFSKHASETPILIRLINRIQTQDINNPQYIKLKTSSDAIVKEDNIVLITLNDLINDLIEENNI